MGIAILALIMVLPGHIAGGYITTQLVLYLGQPILNSGQLGALTIIGVLAGELPDIDLIRLYFDERKKSGAHKKNINHREYFTHAPMFWLLACLAIVGIGLITSSTFVEYIGWLILAGTWGHLILDSIDDGVMWLWPFSKKTFGIFRGLKALEGGPHTMSHYWHFITRKYPGYCTFYAEILVTFIAIVMISR